MKNVAVISLGCDKNRVDTERMLYRISRGGYGICDISDADAIVINTCAFIESARQESIDTILSCAELKKTGKLKTLIVTGCLPQKYSDELKSALPEVDAFLGAFEYDKIVDAIEGEEAKSDLINSETEKFYADENVPRLLTTFPHTAYVKIAEGCDNHCTFCTIPSIRGRYRSRPIADVVSEAKSLVDDGVKELILVAQDVTRFGEDRGKNELIELLTELEKLSPEFGIKLLYCYPERVTDALIEKIAGSDSISPYIDIPIQHVADNVLKRMNRKTTGAQIEALIAKLHAKGITVRTTLMVGFPGESDGDFNELCEFVKRAKPDYTGLFAYSKEDGTPAARLDGHIKKSDKLKRVKQLGKICSDVMLELNRQKIGKVLKVLYEDVDYDKNMFVGRAETQVPDVDGRVYFTSNAPVEVGTVYNVKINDADEYDLYGVAEQIQKE